MEILLLAFLFAVLVFSFAKVKSFHEASKRDAQANEKKRNVNESQNSTTQSPPIPPFPPIKSKPKDIVLQETILRICELKKNLADLQEAIQKARLFEKSLNKNTSNLKESDHVFCFFCDERINGDTLVCPHCGNPNYKNMKSIIEKEISIYKILSNRIAR